MNEQRLIDIINGIIDADVRAHCPACASGFEKEVHACGEGEYIRARAR